MYKLKCLDCGKEFVLSDSEIRFYKEKGFKLPKRCKECRQRRKKERNSSELDATDLYEQNIIRYQSTDPNDARTKWKAPLNERMNKNNGSPKRVLALVILLLGLTGMIIKGLVTDADKTETTNRLDNQQVQTVEEDTSGNQDVAKDDAKEVDKDKEVQEVQESTYTFRTTDDLLEHFQKHGDEFGYADMLEYEAGANAVILNSSSLHKLEAEDEDEVYYLESTNEFVVVSTDGYIRTYFKPDDGKEYFDRQ